MKMVEGRYKGKDLRQKGSKRNSCSETDKRRQKDGGRHMMKVEATPTYSRGGKKLCVCFILFCLAAEIVVVTGIPAVMKTILYVRATAVAETIRHVRAAVAAVAETIRRVRAAAAAVAETIWRVRAAAAVKALRHVRTAVQAICPCRTFARRRDAAVIAIVAVPGTGSMAASASAVMFVTIAVSMRCAVAAIIAEIECIVRKRRLIAAFFEFEAVLAMSQHAAVLF